MAKKQTKSKAGSTKLGFEEKLWQAADKLRGHLDAAEYKHEVITVKRLWICIRSLI